MTSANPLWRVFERWLRALPPLLGAVVDGFLFGVLSVPLLFRGSLERQMVLLVVVVVLLGYASYRLRSYVRRSPEVDASRGDRGD